MEAVQIWCTSHQEALMILLMWDFKWILFFKYRNFFKILKLHKGIAKIPYAYCLELKPGESDKEYNQGFLLPEYKVKEASNEAWAGIRAFLNSIRK
jgi:hypothetical protein